ncbi:MAG TPA: hypothetical protein DCM28_23095 [Phycisphaerales bacterium]|nr:hypothetical protein [Phycisphaerales bacterium]HCD32915.1 hypothetical protein [Phycisphaerales bacterium]|tara:strand:- start:1662 stop:2105 length:444 start_codon:yes stop_codon:yes gene_type:complete
MKTQILITTLLTMFFATGCIVHVETTPPADRLPPIPCDTCPDKTQVPRNEEFQTRLEAAQRITSFQTRDEVLADIANDAAQCQNAKYALRAITGITSFQTRDEAACTVAERFIDDCLFTHAKEVAKKVTSFQTRDAILKKIATSTCN